MAESNYSIVEERPLSVSTHRTLAEIAEEKPGPAAAPEAGPEPDPSRLTNARKAAAAESHPTPAGNPG